MKWIKSTTVCMSSRWETDTAPPEQEPFMPLANLQDLTSANCKNTCDKVQNLTPVRLPVLPWFRITTLLRTRDAVGKFKGMVHPIHQRSLCCNIYIFYILSKVNITRVKVKGRKGQGQRLQVKVNVLEIVFYPIDSWEVQHGRFNFILWYYSFIQYLFIMLFKNLMFCWTSKLLILFFSIQTHYLKSLVQSRY